MRDQNGKTSQGTTESEPSYHFANHHYANHYAKLDKNLAFEYCLTFNNAIGRY
jgi:hypothetical protein